MADVKLSQLTVDSSPSLTDRVPTVKDPGGVPLNRAISLQTLLDLIETSGAAPASFISSGTFDNARISQANVTQHQAALTITESQISDLSPETDPVVGAINGIVKANGSGTISAAVAGTDYAVGSHTHTASQVTDFNTAADARADSRISAAIGSTVQGYDVDTLKSDTTRDLTAGYTTTPFSLGSITSGVVTPAFANGNLQTLTNNGAFTLAPPSTGSGTMLIQVINGATADVITTSGFNSVTGDTLTTANGDHFIFSIAKIGSRTYLSITAASDN